jgi:uncharacterized protein (DUF697 family)
VPISTKKATANAEVLELNDLSTQDEQADALIKRYALLGTATGLIPTFGLDVAAATAVQTKMINDLADVYGYDIDDQLIRTAITTGVAALGGRILSSIADMVAASFTPLKILVSGATSAAISGFLTYEIGKIYQAQMQAGKNPSDIGVMEIVNHVVAEVQSGKWDPANFSVKKQLTSFIENPRQR